MAIRLRKYRGSDLERHLELFLMNGICDEINEEIKSQEGKWLEKVILNYKKEKPEFFVLAVTLDGEVIGNLVAEKIDYKKKILDIGFWIGKDYWGKGIMTKALGMFLEKIKDKFKVNKILASCKKDNIGSSRVLEKSGFTIESKSDGMISYSLV